MDRGALRDAPLARDPGPQYRVAVGISAAVFDNFMNHDEGRLWQLSHHGVPWAHIYDDQLGVSLDTAGGDAILVGFDIAQLLNTAGGIFRHS